MANIYDEVMNEIAIIKKYNDGKKLNDLYKRSIDDVMKSLHRLEIINNKKQSVAQYCTQHKNSKYEQFLQELCIFDSPLVDAKLVHSIVGIQNKPYILIFAGGAHINNVFDLLGQMGYKHEYSSPVSFVDATIKQSLHIKGNSLVHNRPKAIDIRIIEKFMR